MLPSVKFLEMDLYTWMILIGILTAMVCFNLLSGKLKLPAKVFNFSLFVAIGAIVFGFIFAILFQSYYRFLATGEWEWNSGMTFYGGLIGAVISFLLIYFIAGHFLFKDKLHIHKFNLMLMCILPCIVVAHAFGRIGCLFAGCCHGAVTDSPIGIPMHINGNSRPAVNVVPIQLFESIFLFLLFGALLYLLLKKKSEYIASIYIIAYGVWRFIIEFWRADKSRGSSGISWLSPSQLTAIIMVIIGVALIFLYKRFFKRILENYGKKVIETES